MSEHEAYMGITVDHLYQNCPNLQKAIGTDPARRQMIAQIQVGRRLVGDVDPQGTDICGWCRRKWEGTQ